MNMLTNGANFNGPVTMSSREIAELCEKRHDNVKRTIETLVGSRTIARPQIEDVKEAGGNGRLYASQLYLLDKRSSLIVVAQLSPEFTARLVDRWQELEAEKANGMPAMLTGAQLMAAALIEADATMRAQTAQIEAMAPKAQAFDRLDTAEGNLTVRPAAKVLGMPEHKFMKWLEAHRWAFRQGGKGPLQAYVEKRTAGYVDHKLGRYVDQQTGEDKCSITLVITPKGMARLAVLIGGAA